jgi:hypothetical protein
VQLKKRQLLLAVPAAIAVVAAGCGGSKAPSVASLGPTSGGTTTSSGAASSGAQGSPNPGTFVKFVDCMQKHGVQAQLAKGGAGVSISGVSPGSPQLTAAQAACRKLLPGGGPKPLSPAQEAQERQELLVIAKCMRAHGYPSFPDPDSQGVFDFSGSSTVDPGSPQFQRAMGTCSPRNASVPLRIGIRVTATPGSGGP